MTAMGSVLLKSWVRNPLVSINEIGQRQSQISTFVQSDMKITTKELRRELKLIPNIPV